MQVSKAVQTKEKTQSFLFYQELELLMQQNFMQDFLYLFLNEFWGRVQRSLEIYMLYICMKYFNK